MSDEDDRMPVKTDELIFGVDFDTVDYTYPTPASEVITQKLGAVLIRTVTVIYTSANKKEILSVVSV
jgi:hypothetical protein